MRAVWLILACGWLAIAQDEKPRQPGYLGVTMEELDAEARRQHGLGADEGVVLTSVVPGSPAAAAGLKEGDILVALDDSRIGAVDQLSQIIREKGAGSEVTLTVLRDGKREVLKAKLGARPGAQAQPAGDPPDRWPPVEKTEDPIRRLALKCGTDLDWLALSEGKKPVEILEEAKRRATALQRMILWYVFRIPGPHLQSYSYLDRYMLTGPFSDPDVAELLRRKFVLLRLSARDVGGPFGLKALEVMEPALVFLRPDGTVVHRVERIRSMSPDFVLDTLRLVLDREPALNGPSDAVKKCQGDQLALARELIWDGDYTGAAKVLASLPADGRALYLSAVLHRRQYRAGEALEALNRARELLPEEEREETWAEEGLVLLRAGRVTDARKAFARVSGGRRAAEAAYYLGVCEYLSADERKATEIWKRLAGSQPETPWAWRAAACVTGPANCFLGDSGLTHAFEDPLWPIEKARHTLLTGSEVQRGEAELRDVAAQAVRFLLRHQRSNGSWADSRYVFGQGPVILPNVWMAVSALACAALLEWREVDAEAVDRALERALPYLLEEKNLNRGKYETSYADAFRLYYMAKRTRAFPKEKDALVKAMNDIVEKLGKLQRKEGFWWHEYPNPFVTGMVLVCLDLARRAGAEVPREMVERGVAALKGVRSKRGTFPYYTRGASSARNASGRMPLCELALLLGGEGTRAGVEAALDNYLQHEDRLNRVRKSDYHADGELAGFFYYHSMLGAVEAASALEGESKEKYLREILRRLLRMVEVDGSFAEDHEIGKSYSTAVALLCLKRCAGAEK